MTPEKLAHRRGATMGLILMLNGSLTWPDVIGDVTWILALSAYVAVLVLTRRSRSALPVIPQPVARGAGRRSGLALLFALVGCILLTGPLDMSQAVIPWVTFVIGACLVGPVAEWRWTRYLWLGATIWLCGAVGLVFAATGLPDGAIRAVAGVLPGSLILGFGLWRNSGVRAREAAWLAR